ncbi:MAG: hypothetical protein IPJ28_10975 [Betaproteobacteria bacterium]|nr:hypothetical protein [Betaproteobacteria bacterium]
MRFANDDAAEDLTRSRQRMKAAKDAVEQLHAAGLASIERAKDRLGGE